MTGGGSILGYVENGRVMNSSKSNIGYIERGYIMNSSKSTKENMTEAE